MLPRNSHDQAMKKQQRLTTLIAVLVFASHNWLTAQSIDDILTKTNEFVASLSAEEKKLAIREVNDTSRVKWTNLPLGLAPRPGIRYGDLSESSKIHLHHILTTLLSSQGYLKSTSIMQLDEFLLDIYEVSYQKKEIDEKMIGFLRDLKWAYGNYYFTVWGKPEKGGVWGLKLEGHHLSLNLTVAGDRYAMTPLFFGTDPAEVRETQFAGIRILSKEEDYGFFLIQMLSEEQKTKATLSRKVPGDILTAPGNEQRLSEFSGIKGSQLTPDQKQELMYLIKEYINNLEHEKAEEYLAKLEKTGIDNVYFAWIGSYEPRSPHYYMIHSPDFLIEYDNVGFGGDANHIHAIWRENGNDFGEDILRQHYLSKKH